MAKQRPSVQKRQREIAKRQREQRKADKAAEKRERRLNRSQQDDSPIPAENAEDADATPTLDTENTDTQV